MQYVFSSFNRYTLWPLYGFKTDILLSIVLLDQTILLGFPAVLVYLSLRLYDTCRNKVQ